MEIGSLADIIEALAVMVGLVFAGYQVRDYRVQRRRNSMLNLVQSFQSVSLAHSLRVVVNLPEAADRATVLEVLGENGEDDVYHITGTWESIGLLVFTGELTIEVVEDFFSGPILLSWKKLERYIDGERRRLGRDTWCEWFEWLKNRIEARETDAPEPPAHITHKDHRDYRDASRHYDD